jgi:hypothetical protein
MVRRLAQLTVKGLPEIYFEDNGGGLLHVATPEKVRRRSVTLIMVFLTYKFSV